MKHVGACKRQLLSPVTAPRRSPPHRPSQIRAAVLPMLKQQTDAYTSSIRPQLAANGIYPLDWIELSEAER